MKNSLRTAAFLAALLWAPFSFAQTLIVQSSTPDISISASTSADFPLPGRPWHWIALKNDCATTLYFDLRTQSADADFDLRLESNESFSGPFLVYSVAVSNDGSSACTFTLQGAKR